MKQDTRIVILGIGITLAAQCAAPVSEREIRPALTKPIARMQTTALTWLDHQPCSSCHHQTLPMIVFDLARRRGVSVDQHSLEQMMNKTFGFLADLDLAVQGSQVGFSIAERLVPAAPLGLPRSPSAGAYARLIARQQLADGHWENGDNRPPQAYSTFAATAYALRTLQEFLPDPMETERHTRLQRARIWLEQTAPRDTEDRVFQLFGLKWAAGDPALLAGARDRLLALQQPDGGWSQMPGLPSDAYATGETLAALVQAGGVPASGSPFQKGLRYLLRTQKSDGTWFVASRIHPPAPLSPPYAESGWPYGHDQFISAMGTCWATAALLLALPESPAPPAPLRLASLQPVAPPAWASTVLFGGMSDLQKLLDSGWDPNSTTPNRTTALMMAAPDFEKTALLAGRGANVNAKAKTRFTALMIAANHHATDSVRFLLDHNAEVQPPKSEPAFSGVNAVFLAAYSGDLNAVSMLGGHGADINRETLVFGGDRESPMSVAVERGDSAMAELLIHNGAPVELPDPDNAITLLDLAVFKNDANMARLLIRKGADVNHKDKLGFTPLHWAANVDFGDTAVLEVLLRAGADPAARNKEGLTPLQIAIKYKHSRHQQVFDRLAQ